MRQVRRAAEAAAAGRRSKRPPGRIDSAGVAGANEPATAGDAELTRHGAAGSDVRLAAWRWAQDNAAEDGSLPSGRPIGNQYGRHERWGRLVKRAGLAGELST
jgi:hypothetical protein